MSDIAISCEDVWKSYRIYHQRAHTLKERVLSRAHRYEDFWALKGIDLEVPTGTTLGIIGPNGSGKSTLVKTMAKIFNPNKGTLTVNGSISPLLELGTGFHPELTGKENVFLASSVMGQTKRDVERRYDSIVDFAGIEQFMDIPVKNYSSGMYARLAFAVAISVEPDILLVDEVLSVGDESFQLRCWERITELRSEGRTIVLVSHSLPTVHTLCSEAIWMEDGAVREAGPAKEVVGSYLADVHSGIAEHAMETTGGRHGTGEAEITKVAFLDGEGAEASSFNTGDPFTIRLDYRIHDLDTPLVCGIAVYRADNQAYMFGQNSAQAKVELLTSGQGTVELVVPSLPLLKGSYLVTLALHDSTITRVFDFIDRKHSFGVRDHPDLPVEGGMFHVPAHWKASASTVTV